MARPRFLQIHALTSFPGVLLNRDAAGMAKELPFGGVKRTRISSQALKRRWRFAGQADHEAARQVPYSLQGLDIPMGDRSKEVVERVIRPRARSLAELRPEAVQAIETGLLTFLYGDKAADSKKRQALFFGHAELDYLVEVVQTLAGALAGQPHLQAATTAALGKAEAKQLQTDLDAVFKPLNKNLRALADTTKGAAGLESALFGRMVTSDPEANVDAPVHVAHAFTVHGIERELDYVTAVDDLRSRGDADQEAAAGAAGLFDIDLTSGLFYLYVTVDLTLLVANLGDDADLAARVADRLIRLIAQTSPGAKKGSTSPYSRAEFLLVEFGDEQPRTLANAFRRPVPLNGDVYARTMEALGDHLANLDRAYGNTLQRQQLSVTPPCLDGLPVQSLDELCAGVASAIRD